MARTAVRGPLDFTASDGTGIETLYTYMALIQGTSAGYIGVKSNALSQLFGDVGVRYVYRDGSGTYGADQHSGGVLGGYGGVTFGYHGFIVRCSADTGSGADYYLLWIQDTSASGSNKPTQIIKVVNGSPNVLDTRNVAWANADECWFEAITNGANVDLHVYQGAGSTPLYTVTDSSSPLTSGKPGEASEQGTTLSIDNLQLGEGSAAGGGDTTAPVITSVSGTGGAGSSSGSFTSDEAGTAYWKLTATSTPESVPAYPGAMTGWTSMAMSAGSNPIASLTTTPGTYWLQVAAQDDEATPNRASAPTVSASSFTVTAPPDPPVITDHPDDTTVKRGQTATFNCTATGSGTLTYQWQRNPGGVGSWTDIGGATSSSYTTPATTVSGGSANDQDDYRCRVSDDDAGPTATNAATLTVQQCVLALNTSGYEVLSGNAPATGAGQAGETFEVQVYPIAQWPLTSPVAGASGTLNSSHRLANLGDDDLIFGAVYRVEGRLPDNANEPFSWLMTAG